jgi:hypothetical protein
MGGFGEFGPTSFKCPICGGILYSPQQVGGYTVYEYRCKRDGAVYHNRLSNVWFGTLSNVPKEECANE